MKTFLTALIVTVAGVTLGWSWSCWQWRDERVGFPVPVGDLQVDWNPASVSPSVSPGQNGSTPRVDLRNAKVTVVGGESHDFGVMEPSDAGSHAFPFRNDGTVPLILEKGTTTCKCTVSEIPESRLEPGKTVDVKLEWKPRESDIEMRQSAEIHVKTLDGQLVRFVKLSIEGIVGRNVLASPNSVVFSTVPASEGEKTTVHVYSFKSDQFQITGHELAMPETAEWFDVRFSPLSPDAAERTKGVLSGVDVTVTLKPGLPLGPLQQTLKLTTNLPQQERIEIPISARVVGDITILGKDFRSESNQLSLGIVSTNETTTAELILLVKGPMRDQIEFTLGPIEPDRVLKATLGETSEVVGGKSLRVPLKIEIPRGSPVMSRLGPDKSELGRVTLKSNHPQAREMPIWVRFAVQDR